ncbi:MAG: FGGY family carbohydrate kinase [Candidatus Eremiobacteraeota bacterium]|nr:FGGY family carbohydrate kinase [Candidatus Eremiobacteraeota bacterium]
MKKYILSVDIGTGGCKSFLFDEHYKTVASSSVAYPRKTFGACLGEQDPDELLSIFLESIKRCVAQAHLMQGSIVGMGLAASPYAFLGVQRDGTPLTAISWWGDKKVLTRSEARPLLAKLKDTYQESGCPFHPSFPLSRILWLREREARTFTDVYKFVSLKSYLVSLFCNEFIEDISTASGTGLLDIKEKAWSREVLRLLEISEARLPRIVSPYQVIGVFPEEYAKKCGIYSSIPMVIGASDSALASLGTLSMKIQDLCINLGFTGSLQVVSRANPIFDPEQRMWYHLLDADNYVWGGTTSNGSGVVRWFVQQFFPGGLEPAILEKEMAKRFKKPGEIICFPFFWGERTPFWNPHLSGTFTGLNFTHSPFDILYALMEGISFSIYSIFEIMQEIASTRDRIRLTGGGFHWNFFSQHLCDLFERPLEVATMHEGTALGTAAVVKRALGLSLGEEQLLKASGFKTLTPQKALSEVIKEKYCRWKSAVEKTLEFLSQTARKDSDYLDFYRKPSQRMAQSLDEEDKVSLRFQPQQAAWPVIDTLSPMERLPVDLSLAERIKLESLPVYKLPDIAPEKIVAPPPPPPPPPMPPTSTKLSPQGPAPQAPPAGVPPPAGPQAQAQPAGAPPPPPQQTAPPPAAPPPRPGVRPAAAPPPSPAAAPPARPAAPPPPPARPAAPPPPPARPAAPPPPPARPAAPPPPPARPAPPPPPPAKKTLTNPVEPPPFIQSPAFPQAQPYSEAPPPEEESQPAEDYQTPMEQKPPVPRAYTPQKRSGGVPPPRAKGFQPPPPAKPV